MCFKLSARSFSCIPMRLRAIYYYPLTNTKIEIQFIYIYVPSVYRASDAADLATRNSPAAKREIETCCTSVIFSSLGEGSLYRDSVGVNIRPHNSSISLYTLAHVLSNTRIDFQYLSKPQLS